MQPQTHYTQSGDCSIAYQVIGDGPMDLVFVPGVVSHLDLQWTDPGFSHALRRLASFSRLIIFDNRGAGLSDRPLSVPRLEQRVDDMRAVMQAASVTRAAVIGHCNGGPTSLLFTAMHPERVSALVVCSSFAKGAPDDEHPGALSEEDYERALRAIEHWGEGLSLELFRSPSLASSALFRRLYGLFERAALSPGLAHAIMASTREIDVTALLPTISVPTLIAHCTDDYMCVDAGRFIAEEIPGARFVELPGADHTPFAGRGSEALLDAIEEFLTGQSRAVDSDKAVATVLFTDIVGSTKLAVELGDRRWRELLEDHDLLVREEIERFGGREVKSRGDGFLATFDGPERAVRCARSICERAEGIGMQVRAGLHTGECEIVGPDVAGLTVHIGARLADVAGPGEVLVSKVVRDLVVGSALEFSRRGNLQLHGVPGRWSVFAVERDGGERTASKSWSAPEPVHTSMSSRDRAAVAVAKMAPWLVRGLARFVTRAT